MDRISSLFFCILLVCFFGTCLTTNIKNIITDQSALLGLKAKNAPGHDNILAKNWSSRISVCNWIGVTCSSRQQRVVALNISTMNLIGSIPKELGNLSVLVSLDMWQYFPGKFA
ncbi:hypothetical protein ACH5RR_018196 [Cinchona calisaya]|uniref:Leucine-rich repeat-containing N-terminal plant-type domain-containing protein n=1 Tax=Cinchona calisaya TaxID=153742 RepID=A0ABD2ZKS7_9GENT